MALDVEQAEPTFKRECFLPGEPGKGEPPLHGSRRRVSFECRPPDSKALAQRARHDSVSILMLC